jgi:hypothetical protein
MQHAENITPYTNGLAMSIFWTSQKYNFDQDVTIIGWEDTNTEGSRPGIQQDSDTIAVYDGINWMPGQDEDGIGSDLREQISYLI